MFFSVVIPVYNRPDELADLLDSLTRQTVSTFEVLVVEDGSTVKADQVVAAYQDRLQVRYFEKPNTGQGFSRNYGFERAKGDYFVVFDSDAVIPPGYFAAVATYLEHTPLDAYGGPDAASPDFSATQKAISYAMTSVFTTGGIRGKTQNAGGTFVPRSFNMGLSRRVFAETGGFAKRDMGEDMELSTRLLRLGYRVGLIPDAFVYHKRRGTLGAFFRQITQFGRTRVQLKRQYGIPIKIVHLFPVVFTLGWLSLPLLALLWPPVALLGLCAYGLFAGLVLADAARQERSLRVGLLSVAASFTQLSAYGLGFLGEWTGWYGK
ncbi:glycosyltransferase family 2 protein [Fibrella sp. WM1]|uniref:glycosyltransferase n=1 Tax=Fibrella musci TaxID=3242485 RepID=UPI003522C275